MINHKIHSNNSFKRHIMKKLFTISAVALGIIAGAQTTLINPATGGGFESGATFAANGWTEVQVGGGAANKWFVGTATTFAGTRSAYISNNGGTGNVYNNAQSRIQHFYQDVTFPAGEPYVTLSFRWKGDGESCCDYMQVFLVPTSTTPVGGTALATGQIGGNYNTQTAWQTATISLPCNVAGTTQRLVFSWRCDGSVGNNPPNAVDNISLVSSATGSTCAALLGTGVTNVASLPYASGAGTTCGAANDITNANAVTCGASWYYDGEDRIWVFTPTSSGTITCSVASTGSYVGLALYQGCPLNSICSGSGTCVAFSQSSSGNQSFCATVTSGQTYYLVMDSYPSPNCNAYTNVTISAPSGTPAGTTCGNAPAIALPYTATGHTTTCYGNDYTNASSGSCGSLYESGEDRVYALTVAAATCIGITLSNASTTSIGFQVYNGCPGSGGTCIGSAGGSNPLSGTVTLPAAGTYYIIVDTWASPSNCNYDINVVNYGSGPANDLPCNATALALNTNLTGDNSCSGSASEPGVPACWSTGTMHTVWYSVVCPASGQLMIRTTLGTLSNTQIALYSGTCGSLTLVACNDDAPACGSSSYLNSQITATGLTSGATYWIRVDGVNDLTGTFDVMAVNGAVGFPAAAGQDCSSPNPVCAQTITIGNPGYQAYGNICDFSGGGTNCLASGERGSAWYTIPINANGTLTFDIVPNDYGNPNPITGQVNPWVSTFDETDYDFAIWKTTGSGATNCAGIAGGATPLRCNYSGLGVTGCYTTTGTAPPAYPGFGAAYEASIPVLAGEVYVLVVSNFSNSTSGFSLVFGATSPINYTAAGSTVTWTGGTNTSWTLASNWGGCTPPVCGISAVIVPAATNQPTVIAGNFYVNDLTVNPGATLTLLPGSNLHICGNFTNLGSIVASPTSTVTFDNGSTNHQMTGAFVGADALGNLVITQTGGAVTLNNNIDLKGSFTTSNATSVLNLNGKYLKVAGNFTNAAGNTTVTNTAGSTVEFNGTGAQTYNQGSSTLTLNNVVMNHTGPGVTCATNMVLGTSGVMTLTLGRIITNAFEVQITNTASAACTAGNTSSFVQGNLRRYLNGAATSYDFPVGHATNGYQRANITFTSATTIPQLLARFDTYGVLPLGPLASECPTNTYNALQVLNNGYWTISASANPTSGTYTTTLYNTNYTNSAGAAGWTVIKGTSTATYALNGTCAASTVNTVVRTGMNGFSVFGVGQSVLPLPVELVSFTGFAFEDHNRLEWTTASEVNNHFFDLERSDDGINFFSIGRVNGHGTTSMRNDYSFNDYSPIEGTNYYRLRQVDYNGAVTYSQIVTIEFHRGNMTVTNIKPNPTNGEVNFDFNSPLESTIHVVITDVTGRVVRDEYREIKAGTTLVNTFIDQSGAGIYTMIVTEEKSGFRSVSRIVKY
jgi:hypothetical protein